MDHYNSHNTTCTVNMWVPLITTYDTLPFTTFPKLLMTESNWIPSYLIFQFRLLTMRLTINYIPVLYFTSSRNYINPWLTSDFFDKFLIKRSYVASCSNFILIHFWIPCSVCFQEKYKVCSLLQNDTALKPNWCILPFEVNRNGPNLIKMHK